MTDLHNGMANVQRVLKDFVNRNVVHNLCQTMEMFGEHDQDTFLEMSCRRDYEAPARETGWIPYDEYEGTYPPDEPEAENASFVCFDELNPEDWDTFYWSVADDWAELCDEEDISPHEMEVLEYWAVDPWFGKRLEAEGEIVQGVLDFTVWGRTCSGQAIALDCVVFSIAKAMGILPGQVNDWSKHE